MFRAVRFEGYKSFPNNIPTEIPELNYINVFIGKNNCGKSSALDVIQGLFDVNLWNQLSSGPQKISCMECVDEHMLQEVYGNTFRGITSVYTLKQPYVGRPLWYEVGRKVSNYSSTQKYIFDYLYDEKYNERDLSSQGNWDEYIRRMPKPKCEYAKLAAERDINPEIESHSCSLNADGRGATNLIRRIINHQKYDEKIIEVELLAALNKIMGSDAQFESIRVQESEIIGRNADVQWEVYLQEKNSNRFPLSKSGSGLKTIILVLLNLLVLPKIDLKKEYVFGFEELENNLHPALQRRLFEYIYNYAIENKIHIFITTHSHVAINMFFGKEHTSLYHVIKEDQVSSIKKIDNYLDKVEILDDLDVKASDLLQANGVIWVEGPSDRVYIKKWLEVFGGDDVNEGQDFQFAYYGGRLLSHYTADEEIDLLNVLLINRNSAIVIDSDKRNKQAKINDTKKRIVSEFDSKNMFSWVTKGKEIENYIAVSSIQNMLDESPKKQCDQYEHFPDYIEPYYKNFKNNKVPFANKLKDYILDDNVMDLKEQIQKLYQEIKAWNK